MQRQKSLPKLKHCRSHSLTQYTAANDFLGTLPKILGSGFLLHWLLSTHGEGIALINTLTAYAENQKAFAENPRNACSVVNVLRYPRPVFWAMFQENHLQQCIELESDSGSVLI